MTFYDQNIPASRRSMDMIPPITNGISDLGWAQDAKQGFADTLQNCTYQGKQLLLGRGKDEEAVDTSYAATIGAFKKLVYDDSSGNYYGITNTYFCKVDVDAGTVTSILHSTTSPGFTDICIFNGDVMLAKGTYLYRYDGSHTFACGSIKDDITIPIDFGNLSDTDYTSTGTTSLVTGTSGSDYGRVVNIQALLKKTGTVAGEVYLEFVIGSTTYRTEKVNVDVGIGYEYAIVSFDLLDLPTLPPSTGWEIKINVSEGDASNYISSADISSVVQTRINGPTTPRATGMVVFNGRLYCFMDEGSVTTPDEYYPVYYCNYNNADDWFSTSSDGLTTYGGYFYLNDDVNSRVKGLTVFRHMLAVSGLSGGRARTELRDTSNTVVNATTDAVDSNNCLLATPTQVFFVHPKSENNNFSLYAWTGVEDDVTVGTDLAAMVAQGVGDQWSSGDEVIAEVDDWADTLWVCHGQQSELYVFFIKSGQWTTFTFSFTVNGISYTNQRLFLFGTDGSIHEYKHGVISDTAETVVETKKLRLSHFSRVSLKEFLWYIEHSDFTGKVTISSELGATESNYYIVGSPPQPVRVRGLKDMSFSFKITDVGISAPTPVGELVVKFASDGRSIT